ncbi:MAG TPA: HAMP domain-containing sensor histidine kinase [Gemmatimonadaceae bacterium]|nr:HAMP domain-containing sensor histidine kinase [Gemmatimonadaceae bacterium]
MNSSRARLTLWYASALIATTLALGIAVYAARRVGAIEQVARRASSNADLTLRILGQSRLAGDTIRVIADSLIGPVVSSRVRLLLEAVPGYVIVKDEDERIVFTSRVVQALEPRDVSAILAAAEQLTTPGHAQRVFGSRFDLLVVRRQERTPDGRVWEAITAVDTELGVHLREVLGALFLAAPLIMGFSIGGAWLMAGRVWRPLDRVINEMEAITDGRSLHRRLAQETTGDELARLVTTLNAMIGRLETSFGGLRRFTADASHELKTPLTVVRTDLERAMRARPGSHEQMSALEEALQETTRMADLVESLLTLARADEGRFDLHREPVDLEDLARDVFETATLLGERHAVTVNMVEARGATVLGDRTRLRQLFLNLVTNAIKYTRQGGTVDVLLTRTADTVSFAVRDTGIGISAADLPHVFERFWRADRARSRSAEKGGFGLGLAISHWIAQAHGGTLTVQSRLTRGSTFTATFPIARIATVTPLDGVAVTES